MEHRSVRQTTTAIKELGALQPNVAKVITIDEKGDEAVSEIPVSRIEKGILTQINTGDKIPLDGEIVSGKALVDESMITGESVPVLKKAGDQVVGGTILTEGNARVEITATGDATVLSKIINLVKAAQSSKPPIQKLADKISAWFVPIVVTIALGTFFLSLSLIHI